MHKQAVTSDDHTGEHTRRMSPHEVKVRRNYSLLSISNDILIGIWFLVGSFFFFSDQLMFQGTCLFVIGSVEMLVRPVIRLIRQLHLQYIRGVEAKDASWDF